MSDGEAITILIADDDEEDRVLTQEALSGARLTNDLRFVVDGEDLMDYLRHEGRYAADTSAAPVPGIILLDLNMPKLDGREALAEIKADPNLRADSGGRARPPRAPRPTSCAPTSSASTRSSPSP